MSTKQFIFAEGKALKNLAINTVFAIPSLVRNILLFAPIWLFVFGAGVILWGLEEVFLYSIPIDIKGSVVLEIFIDVIIVVLKAVGIGIEIIIAGVNIVMSIVGQPAIPDNVDTSKLAFVTASAIRSFLRKIPPICKKYNGPSSTVLGITRYVGHSSVCPVHRYVWPYQPLYYGLHFFSWFYIDSASPEFPNIPGTNCNASDTYTIQDWICIGFGFGYVLMAVGVFLAVMTILDAFRHVLWTAFNLLLLNVYIGIRLAEFSVFTLLSKIF
jgi:hypothetical protein